MAGKPHILMIEDNIDTLRAYERILEFEGYQVSHAVTGTTGLELLKTIPVDVVMVDLRLPDMDGLEVVEQIRKLNRNVPIIVVSAYPPTTMMAQCQALGVSAFLLKPSTYETLCETLDRYAQTDASAKSAQRVFS